MSSRRTVSVLLIGGAILGFATMRWFFDTRRVTSPDRNGPSNPALGGAAATNPFLPPGVPDLGWPFVRGPTYNGHSAEIGLPDTWPSEGPPVLWNRPLGQGFSAFTAVGNRAFTQYQTLAGQYVICLSADTGETIWEYRYDWPYEAGGVYLVRGATPTVAEGRIYFAAPPVGSVAFHGRAISSGR